MKIPPYVSYFYIIKTTPLQFSFWPQRSQKSWYSCSMVIPHRGHFGNLAPHLYEHTTFTFQDHAVL